MFVGMVVLVVAGIGAGVYHYGPSTQPEQWHRFTSLLSKDKMAAMVYGEGGDIAPVPPVLPPPLPELQGTLPLPETFSAESIFVKDAETGIVLYAKQGYTKHSLASVTKLMTALVLLEHTLDSQKILPVVSDALAESHVYTGEQYTEDQLWEAMLVASSNKAAMTLVDATSWSREAFVERMNQKAIELGMGDTHFVEPTGLDAENVSTGSDISILLSEALKQEAIVREMLKKEVTIQTADTHEDRHLWNTNWLATGWVPHHFSLLGGKTGFIDASGYNVAVRLGHEDGRKLDIIILGASTHEARFTEARDIAEGVFAAYTWPAGH